jgi:hypothetical protein
MRWNFFKSSHFTKIENEIRLDFLKIFLKVLILPKLRMK